MQAYSGSNVHNVVKDVGHFFGHDFKPWEAAKITRGIGKVGNALGVLSFGLSIWSQVRDDQAEEKREKGMKEGRESIRAEFENVANEVDKHFNAQREKLVHRYFQTEIDAIDKKSARSRRYGENA